MLPNCRYAWNGIEYSISVKAQPINRQHAFLKIDNKLLRIEAGIESHKTGKPKQKIHPD